MARGSVAGVAMTPLEKHSREFNQLYVAAVRYLTNVANQYSDALLAAGDGESSFIEDMAPWFCVQWELFL